MTLIVEKQCTFLKRMYSETDTCPLTEMCRIAHEGNTCRPCSIRTTRKMSILARILTLQMSVSKCFQKIEFF